MDRRMKEGVTLIVLGLVVSVGLGYYFGTITIVHATSATQQSNSVYHLTLIESMNSGWNATTAQPRFYVVGKSGLESSANISLPARTLIEVTIISYDTPTPGSLEQQGKVTGTVGGTVYLINGTTASQSSTPEQWGKNVASVPATSLAHTFTIQQLGVNIPVVGGDAVIAFLYFTQTGTFTWLCLTPCGFGPNGSGGAMSASGWMTGTITIS